MHNKDLITTYHQRTKKNQEGVEFKTGYNRKLKEGDTIASGFERFRVLKVSLGFIKGAEYQRVIVEREE